MRQAAAEAGLRFELLDWRHPRQTWALFAAPKFDSGWFKNKPLTWNAGVAKALAKNKAGNVPSAAPAASADFSHAEGHVYEQDGLRSIHNHEFMDDPAFRNAYERGVRAAGDDYRWHWRGFLGLWGAARPPRRQRGLLAWGAHPGVLFPRHLGLLKRGFFGKNFFFVGTFLGV